MHRVVFERYSVVGIFFFFFFFHTFMFFVCGRMVYNLNRIWIKVLAGRGYNIKCGRELFYAEGMCVYMSFIIVVCVYGYGNASALCLFVCVCHSGCILYVRVFFQRVHLFMQMFAVYMHVNACVHLLLSLHEWVCVPSCSNVCLCTSDSMNACAHTLENPAHNGCIRSVIAAALLRAASSASQYTPACSRRGPWALLSISRLRGHPGLNLLLRLRDL